MNYHPIEWARISDNKRFKADSWPLSKNVHAVAGIGNPAKFLKFNVKKYNLNIF